MSQIKKQRIDKLLVEWGLAPSRAKAQELIKEGAVQILRRGAWQSLESISEMVAMDHRDEVRVSQNEVLDFVSRGGRKMNQALQSLNLVVEDFRVLDLGQSTGGFTDCALQSGAREVVGLDVGEGQLHPSLREDKRVVFYSGINVRDLSRAMDQNSGLRRQMQKPFDLILMDLSFISLTLVIPLMTQEVARAPRLLALVKPQFEVDRKSLSKKGVVLDQRLHDEVRRKIEASLLASGWQTRSYFPCALKGQDGNQEYFVYATRE